MYFAGPSRMGNSWASKQIEYSFESETDFMRRYITCLIATAVVTLGAGCGGGGGGGTQTQPNTANAAKKPATHHKDEPHDWWHSSVTIENSSDWAIHHLYLTPFDSTAWGEDQLGKDVIKKGQALELKGIDCDSYDIKLVDEMGDECVVQDIDLCLQDAKWELDNAELVGCQVKTAEKGNAN